MSGANRRVPGCRWGELEFPLPFGRSMTSAEEYVHSLDGKTGASLKLSILNPKGRIWTMVAGGGASVIYAGAKSPQTPPQQGISRCSSMLGLTCETNARLGRLV